MTLEEFHFVHDGKLSQHDTALSAGLVGARDVFLLLQPR